MNFLDIIIIVGILIPLTVGALACQITSIIEKDSEFIIEVFITWLIIFCFVFIISFVNIDKKSGSTVGTITSVDKNFFGTTALYIKTTETTEEQYCIEDNKLAEGSTTQQS